MGQDVRPKEAGTEDAEELLPARGSASAGTSGRLQDAVGTPVFAWPLLAFSVRGLALAQFACSKQCSSEGAWLLALAAEGDSLAEC